MDRVDAVVVGAGVVGLAAARALAQAGREVLVLEAAAAIGTGTSSRNSEVIHGGMYYPPGSAMARFCVAGRRALYAYCAERGVAAHACGKLIVAAQESEWPKLAEIMARAEANGVEEMRWLTGAEARAMEPELRAVAALYSPQTGVVDSHALMLALQGDAEAAGAVFAFRSPVRRVGMTGDGFTVSVEGAEPLHCRMLVNAAGLDAPGLAARMEGLAPQYVPRAWYAKGSYFTLQGRAPFSRLIYPVPEPGGLGVHLTIDLGGQAKFGPDVEWVDAPDYAVDPARAERFYAAIRRYWPGLPDGALQPGYAGIRPKIVPPEVAKQDFVLQGQAVHGVPGLVNLFGIESPGLTASLALADAVLALLTR